MGAFVAFCFCQSPKPPTLYIKNIAVKFTPFICYFEILSAISQFFPGITLKRMWVLQKFIWRDRIKTVSCSCIDSRESYDSHQCHCYWCRTAWQDIRGICTREQRTAPSQLLLYDYCNYIHLQENFNTNNIEAERYFSVRLLVLSTSINTGEKLLQKSLI